MRSGRGASVLRTRPRARAVFRPGGGGFRGGLCWGRDLGRGGVYPQLGIQFIDLTDCDIALWNRPFEKQERGDVKRAERIDT